MNLFVYKSKTALAVNIGSYTITANPGLQFDNPVDILDQYTDVLLNRFTNGVLDNTDGLDSSYVTSSINLTSGHVNDLITANHATVPIVLTITNDLIGGYIGKVTMGAYQAGVAAVSFVAGAGVTLRGTAPTVAQYTIFAIVRVGVNEWVYA